MSNGRALDRHDDDARRGPPGWPQQGQGRGPFAAQSPSGYGEGRTSRGSPQGQWDVNRGPRRQEGGHGRREEQGYRHTTRPQALAQALAPCLALVGALVTKSNSRFLKNLVFDFVTKAPTKAKHGAKAWGLVVLRRFIRSF